MFQNEYCSQATLRCILAAVLALSSMTPAVSASRETPESCAAAVPLDLNTTYRGHGYEDEETSYFRLEIDEPGVVSLEISVPGSSEILPKLGLLIDECEASGIAGGSFAVLERSATHLILAVESPGAYYFRSGAQDPRRPLSDYKLTTNFYTTPVFRLGLPDRAAPSKVQVDPDPDSKAASTKVQVDPDPDLEAASTKVQVDPDPDLKAASSKVQVDLDPDSFQVGSAFGHLVSKLCRTARSDDHGDISTCATPVVIGRSAAGRLGNGWGDDDDYFTFTVTELETVAIGTSGTTDTFGTLFDPWGRQLATNDDGGEGSNFLIVRTLSPGRYVVRVEGSRNAEGSYELALERAGW